MIENSIFYNKGKKMLDDFVRSGGDVNNLTTKDEIYKYIKSSRVKNSNGKILTLEEKFTFLKHPRKQKYADDVKASLIEEIEKYLAQGGSFHIDRKKLPFYEKLVTYSRVLKRNGTHLTHEEIMKDLGYKNFSDAYFRCISLEKLKDFEDKDGYIDSYKSDKLHASVKDIAITYGVPYYFIICLLCDKKLTNYTISVDKIAYTQRLLENHAKTYGTFIGIKRDHPKVYNAFEYLTRYYSDGSELRFSKQEWLDIFGLGDVEHRFKDTRTPDIDISQTIARIKAQRPDGVVVVKNISNSDHSKIVRKAYQMGISISELLKMYGLTHKHLQSSRMSKTVVNEIPYLEEMKQRRDEIISESRKGKTDKLCKEEIFENKLNAVIQVYDEYKEKLLSYLPNDDLSNLSNEI